jgi:hypothetical protein
MQKKSSKKTPRIIFNNDGGTLFQPFVPLTDLPFTVENFSQETIGYLRNTQVDVLSWTLGADTWPMPDIQGPGRASNMYCHQTDVGERFYALEPPFQSKSWRLLASRVKEMISAGNDPPRVLIEHGHKSGLDVFCAFRMNDSHDGRIVEKAHLGFTGTKISMRRPVWQNGQFIEENIRGYICKFKREHPELLIGEHEALTRLCSIAFDYSHQTVRDFRLALIEEACQKYDIDGIELDFLRHPIYFKPGQEQANMDLMTELISKVRSVLDRIGQSRGKYLTLAVRTLVPLEASRSVGLDVEAWLQAGFLDVLIGGVEERNQLQLSDVVQVAHAHNCSVAASIRTDSLRDYGPEAFRAIAANHYRAGVDGLYLFNMTALRYKRGKPGFGPGYDFQPLREIGSFEEIQFQNKRYFLDDKGAGHRINPIGFDEWSQSMQDHLLRSEVGTTMDKPQLPIRLEAGKDATIHFTIADDPDEAQVHNLILDVVIRMSISDLTGGIRLVGMALNGDLLSKHTLSDEVSDVLEVPVDVSLLRCGANVLTLSLVPEDAGVISELRLNNVEIIVEYHNGQEK